MLGLTLIQIKDKTYRKEIALRELALFLLAVFVILFREFGITCVFRYIFGIPCPTCGMTTALIYLLHFDINGYISANIFALPLAILAYVYIIFSEHINKKLFNAIALVFVISNFIYYIIRNFISI